MRFLLFSFESLVDCQSAKRRKRSSRVVFFCRQPWRFEPRPPFVLSPGRATDVEHGSSCGDVMLMKFPLACLLACMPIRALAGGGFLTNSGATSARSTVVRAALVLEGNLTTLVLHTGFRGDASHVAWVIPTGGLGPALDAWVAPMALFEQLHAETAPSQVRLSQRRQDLGCTEAARSFETPVLSLQVDGLVAGTTSIDVVGGSAAAAMPAWLLNHGYVVPDPAAATIGEYVALGAFYVVARLDNVVEATGETPSAELLGPIGVKIGGNLPILPLAMTRVSTTTPIDVEVYVFATERMEPTDFGVAEVEIKSWLGEDEDMDEWYARRLDENLEAANGPTFLVEYADFVDETIVREVLHRNTSVSRDWFVTRLRTRLLPSQLADVHFSGVGGEPSDQRFRIRAVAGGQPAEAALPTWSIPVAVGAVAVTWMGRRRRRQP